MDWHKIPFTGIELKFVNPLDFLDKICGIPSLEKSRELMEYHDKMTALLNDHKYGPVNFYSGNVNFGTVTQDTMISLEILALQAADKVRMWGLDIPVLENDRYRLEFSQAGNRGVEVDAVVSSGDLPLASLLPSTANVRKTTYGLARQAGWRMYTNQVFATEIVWDSRKRSRIEPSVYFREFRNDFTSHMERDEAVISRLNYFKNYCNGFIVPSHL